MRRVKSDGDGFDVFNADQRSQVAIDRHRHGESANSAYFQGPQSVRAVTFTSPYTPI